MPRVHNGRTIRARTHRRQSAALPLTLVGMFVLGALAPVAPAGVDVLDRLSSGAFAVVVAYAGRRGRRWSVLPAAATGTALAAGAVGLACGVLGIVVAAANGSRRRRNSRLATLGAGLAGNALLRIGDIGPHGTTAVIASLAVLPVLVSGFRHAPSGERRVARTAAAALAGTAVVACLAAAAAGASARQDADRARRSLDAGIEAAKDGETEVAAAHLRDAATAFAAAEEDLDAWWALPARAVPVVGHNLRAVDTALRVSTDVVTAGADAVGHAEDEELEVVDGRVPVDTIAALEAPVVRTLEALLAADRATATPSPWLVAPIAERYGDLREQLDDVRPDVATALQSVRRLPSLLGAGGERRYFVLFVSPVEGRATGFPGNYAEIVVRDGRMDMPVFGRISDLIFATDPQQRSVDMPAEYHGRYDRTVPAADLRNITTTPDFPTVAELIRQLYPQVGGAPIDGVLSVDPAAVAALLDLTGPITVPGIPDPMSSTNAEEYILRGQYEIFEGDNTERVDALESLGRATFDRLTTGSLPGPSTVADVLAPIADAGHLRMVSFVDGDDAFLDQIGITGALPPVVGDSLAVTTNNAISGKVDLYLERDLDYAVAWNPATGEVTAALEVTLRNTAPPSGLPDFVVVNVLPDAAGQALPRGSNRTFLSVFTPLVLDGATLDGTPVALEAQTEKGRLVYSTFVDLLPDGDEAVLRLELSGRIRGHYRLDTWTQLLAIPDDLSFHLSATEPLTVREGNISVNGHDARAEITLDGPRTLAISPRSPESG